jgi:PAS domain S-box-containing protein
VFDTTVNIRPQCWFFLTIKRICCYDNGDNQSLPTNTIVNNHNKEKDLGRTGWQSEFVIGFGCLILVIVVALIEYVTRLRIDFTPFYVLIVAFGAVTLPPKFGIVIAVITAVFGVVRELNLSETNSVGWQGYWNGMMQIVLFLSVFGLAFGFRTVKQGLEQQVRARTQSLETVATERQATEDQLQKALQQFRQIADNISDGLWMRNVGEMRMGYVSPAYESIWGRSSKELYQSPQAWSDAIHIEDRARVISAIETKQITGQYNEEYRVVRPDGSLCWVRDRSFPIKTNSGLVARIVGIAEDITYRRHLEREILEISDREQRRIGQDLHDSLCQKLVTLAFDLGRLDHELSTRAAPEAQTIRRMLALVDDLISEARATARGLFPVRLEADGLHHALQEFAANITARLRINCQVECSRPAFVRDNGVAIQLYRIAQEAVNNAVKHSQAKSIQITLNTNDERIELQVVDDGVGIATPAPPNTGLGLHIMEYRARAIGGVFAVSRGSPSGTAVMCRAPQILM